MSDKKPQTKAQKIVSGVITLAFIGLVANCVMNHKSGPTVDVGQSYTLTSGILACKTQASYDRMNTLAVMQDKTEFHAYMTQGSCDLLKKGDKYAVTDATFTLVEVTHLGDRYWTDRGMFAKYSQP